jgi:hypothetical protein
MKTMLYLIKFLRKKGHYGYIQSAGQRGEAKRIWTGWYKGAYVQKYNLLLLSSKTEDKLSAFYRKVQSLLLYPRAL